MGKDHHTAVLLQRIAQLEATVERLSDDLGSLRAAVNRQGRTGGRVGGTGAAEPAPGGRREPAAASDDGRPAGGLAGAVARGEAARVQWIRDGLLVPGEQLAQAWGLTRQALAPAAERGDIVAVKVGNRLYYPRAFLDLDRASVATLCRALGALGASEKLMFWLREHGSLGGQSVGTALAGGAPLAKVERLAVAWARERGAMRAATAA